MQVKPFFMGASNMTASEHYQAAQQDAKALAQGPLIPAARSAIIKDWVQHMLAYLKGPQHGR